ncbi:MAG: accessory factor UbiK family protein [Alphaproteobacteria bacterium]|nr:accessory factor UbiK family protein [Alphaproteobacteria bacterium]
MPNENLLSDLLDLVGGIVGHLAEARHEMKAQMQKHACAALRGLDLVKREEFDATFAMLAKARDMQEDLSARLSRVEAHLNLKKESQGGAKKTVKTKKSNLPSVKTKQSRSKRK